MSFLPVIISVLIISLVSLIGVVTLALKQNLLKKMILYLVSLAIGALLGDAFIHLLPEIYAKPNMSASFLILLGIMIFFILEKMLRWHHCHNLNCQKNLNHLPTVILVSDTFHNFIDGLLIAASYSVNSRLGLTTSLAIILHEIPQEIGDFGVLIHSGYSVKKALLVNFVSATSAILGALLYLIIGPQIQNFAYYLLPVAAGGFIYIAGTDLVPELHTEVNLRKSFLQFVFIILGIGTMAALKLFNF
jgi:zinc and cadmium transporter